MAPMLRPPPSSRSKSWRSPAGTAFQRGQAFAETILACMIMGLFLLGTHWVWRFSEIKQMETEAVRFAMWERTVYQTGPDGEMYALYADDTVISKLASRYTYLSPQGRSATRGGANHDKPLKDNDKWLVPGARFLVDSAGMNTIGDVVDRSLVVATGSKGLLPSGGAGPLDAALHGMEPTLSTVTNFKLDRDVLDSVTVSAPDVSLQALATQFLQRPLALAKPENAPMPVSQSRRAIGNLSMVTNSWAAPGSVIQERLFKQLNPLSSENPIGKYLVNNDEFFNLSQFIGGKAGLAGNWRANTPGVSATHLSNIISTALGGNNPIHSGSDMLDLLKPTTAYREDFTLDSFALLEPEYSGLACKARVDRKTRVTTNTQDPLCPSLTQRARTLSLDNPAWRYETSSNAPAPANRAPAPVVPEPTPVVAEPTPVIDDPGNGGDDEPPTGSCDCRSHGGGGRKCAQC